MTPQPPTRPRRSSHQAASAIGRRAPALVVAALGLIVTAIVVVTATRIEERRVESDFHRLADQRANAVRRGIESRMDVIRAVSAFYDGSQHVDRDEFRAFVTPLLERHEGIQALEWLPRVPASERVAFEQAARADGLPGYTITERGPDGRLVPAGPRAEYFPVAYAEPLESNERALGFDLASDPVRQQALDRAVTSADDLVATARIRVVQEQGESLATILVLPRFTKGAPVATAAERREHVLGYVLGVLRLTHLVDTAVSHLEPVGIDIRLTDESAPPGERLLSARHETGLDRNEAVWEPATSPARDRLRAEATFEVAGRNWKLTHLSSPEFAASRRSLAPASLLVAGLLCTTLLASYLWLIAGRASRIRTLVNDRTAALRGSEERIRAVLDTAVDGIITINDRGIIESANAATEGLFGFAPDELVGRNVNVLMPSPDTEQHDEYLARYLRTGEKRIIGVGREVVGRRRDGTTFPMYLSIGEFELAGQRQFAGIVRDITERRRAEEARSRQVLEATLLHRAAEMAAATDSLPEALQQVVDMVCVMTDWPVGHVYRPAVGDPDKLLPTKVWHLDDPDGYATFREVTERTTFMRGEGLPGRILESGEATWIENVQTDTNFPRNLLARDLGVKGAFGFPVKVLDETLAVLEFFTDEEVHLDDGLLRIMRNVGGQLGRVFERKRAAEALDEARQAAEQANRAKSQFLANMSHEVRTPMNAIMGMTDLVLDTRLTGDQRDCLSLVRSSSESLLTLLNDILDFSKIEAGRLELDEVEFRLRDVMGETLQALALRAHEKGLELLSDIHAEVPVALVGDPVRLRQIVVNLVGNAIKFTADGEVMVSVKLDSDADDAARLHVVVSDTGIGIPPDKQAHIFHAFRQADGSTTREYGGTGLGLSISSQLVELMEGRLWVVSEPGRGSEFHFTATFGRVLRSAGEEAHVDLEGRSVLVVDDNATNRRIVERLLVNWGMRPTMADGAKAAMALFSARAGGQDPFALVLLDGHMPGMDGFELAAALGESEAFDGQPMIMLTSGAMPGDAARLEGMGIRGCLMKPVRQSELLHTIIRVLSEELGRIGGAARERAHAPAAEPLPARSLHVLLVEDNVANQRLAVHLLKRFGHTVSIANNGREAVDALASNSFDAVLMDVQMPIMDGLEATAAIRERERASATGAHVPIYAMTAHAMKGDRERCLAAGMDGYVSKPIDRAQLRATLDGVATAAPIAGVEVSPASSARPIVARAELLERVDGEMATLREVIALFDEESGRLMSDVCAGIDAEDASRVAASTHTLKGLVANMAGQAAAETTEQLEFLASTGDFEEARACSSMLRRQLDEMRRLLHELATEDAGTRE